MRTRNTTNVLRTVLGGVRRREEACMASLAIVTGKKASCPPLASSYAYRECEPKTMVCRTTEEAENAWDLSKSSDTPHKAPGREEGERGKQEEVWKGDACLG